MNIIEYAKSELDRINKDKDGMQDMINKQIIEIIEMFSNQGHSGFSASYTLGILDRLLRYKPIFPLTGDEDEWFDWQECCGRKYRQNKRCFSVFQEEDGTCHDDDAICVSDNGGITFFTSSRFKKEITFPYKPPIHAEEVYIEYTEEVPPGYSGDKYDIITDDKERIKKLYEKCRKQFDKGEEE